MGKKIKENNLDQIIKIKKTKAEWLAYKLECTTVTVHNWCAHKTNMSKAAVMACAHYLECKAEEIYDGYDY